jgi:hypothetical protein
VNSEHVKNVRFVILTPLYLFFEGDIEKQLGDLAMRYRSCNQSLQCGEESFCIEHSILFQGRDEQEKDERRSVWIQSSRV